MVGIVNDGPRRAPGWRRSLGGGSVDSRFGVQERRKTKDGTKSGIAPCRAGASARTISFVYVDRELGAMGTRWVSYFAGSHEYGMWFVPSVLSARASRSPRRFLTRSVACCPLELGNCLSIPFRRGLSQVGPRCLSWGCPQPRGSEAQGPRGARDARWSFSTQRLLLGLSSSSSQQPFST